MKRKTLLFGWGKRIKQIRGSLSQHEFASLLESRASYISRYEKEGYFPSIETLYAIAKYGNTTVDWILTGEYQKENDQKTLSKWIVLVKSYFLIKDIEATNVMEACNKALEEFPDDIDVIVENCFRIVDEDKAKEYINSIKTNG